MISLLPIHIGISHQQVRLVIRDFLKTRKVNITTCIGYFENQFVSLNVQCFNFLISEFQITCDISFPLNKAARCIDSLKVCYHLADFLYRPTDILAHLHHSWAPDTQTL